ncbi:MAG: hypothetical protein U9N32_10155, partial [Spirochaetota bacterium]|nr:hypothetical protein [Spirochaetota bacterium]
PIHTMYDGDTIFCMAIGELKADPTIIGALAAEVMSEAIVNAVKSAETAYGIPCYNDISKEESREESSEEVREKRDGGSL